MEKYGTYIVLKNITTGEIKMELIEEFEKTGAANEWREVTNNQELYEILNADTTRKTKCDY